MTAKTDKPKTRVPPKLAAEKLSRAAHARGPDADNAIEGGPTKPLGRNLSLPHERDEFSQATAAEPDPVIVQAKRDIDAGMVDTDMRVTPGLDAQRRAQLVPGPGGKPPASRSR
ncbi:MAG: hypothetical protein Q8R98_29085 [Rubrivivax sp.]|nr:hypothetical protein [Rubrivivax sp.]MDP3615913.1 hypothetical protein [Rubrivivax sp.]